MKLRIWLLLIIIPVFLLRAQTADQRSAEAEEIIQKSENLLKGETSHGTFRMTVVTPDYERTLTMESWWVGNEKALIVIESPKREAGNKTLKIGNEMWMYLRNTETTIKIPPSMMLQSWNGSDFTNDDIVRESNLTKDYYQEKAGEEEIGGEICWKIELQPKEDAPVVWGKLFYWVRQKDFLPARIEYYDEKGNQVRHMVFSQYAVFDERKIPGQWSMINDSKTGHRTDLEIIDVEFNVNIPDRKFSFRELERGS